MLINKKKIGDGNPCYITFEAGPTHHGFSSAKRLIKNSYISGADAVKFQILDPERLIFNKNQKFEFEILINKKTGKTKKISKTLYALMKERSLKKKQWIELKKYADKLGISFFATVAFEDEVDFVKKLRCQSIKIASADVTHFPLIDYAAKSNISIQLDTGMSSIDEIKDAVNIIEKRNNKKIIIHHCPSGYPAKLDGVNLNIIKTLKKKFNYPIAFSDHSPGFLMDVVALGYGVNLLEKTITENREYPSVEHMMSLEPMEMKKFVKTVRDIELAKGKFIKKLSKSEIIKSRMIRRSPYLLNSTKKNTPLKNANIIFRRPGLGLTPAEYIKFSKYRFKTNKFKNSLIRRENLKK
jgi:sialic acid synthase SpsE